MSLPPRASDENCAFCKIVRADDGFRVFEDEHTIAFLDHRPLFPGHCLLIPKNHLETINDLPNSLLATLFVNVRLLSTAVELGMRAEGTFVAANNRVSQSVPHFHVHIVPRTKGDGLRDFSGHDASTKVPKRLIRCWARCVRRLRKFESLGTTSPGGTLFSCALALAHDS